MRRATRTEHLMIGLIRRYARWLHTGWPAGTVERLPDVREDGSTNVPGILVAGDLTGVPLLKFAADTGARAVETILAEPGFAGRPRDEAIVDVLIIGAGVAGIAAAARARRADLRIEIVEASEPLSTIVNFPRGKPIFTYPTDMTPRGDLRFDERSDVREGLIDMLLEFIAEHGITPRHGRVERLSRRRDVIDATLVDGTVIRAHRVIVAI
ncbi:MAG: FAD-binding protein, partial [Phycisphaerales bacterium]|nr:FAD-binding protein [Phycisphaerales bacterium]